MPTNVLVPSVGESIKTVIIARWIKKPGDAVQKGASILEIDSDKASLEVPSPCDGVLVEQCAAEGEEIAIGAVIARIEEGAAAAAPAPAAAPEAADRSPKAGPAARQLASSEGVDLRDVEGTGRRGQITRDDVARAAGEPAPAPLTPPP